MVHRKTYEPACFQLHFAHTYRLNRRPFIPPNFELTFFNDMSRTVRIISANMELSFLIDQIRIHGCLTNRTLFLHQCDCFRLSPSAIASSPEIRLMAVLQRSFGGSWYPEQPNTGCGSPNHHRSTACRTQFCLSRRIWTHTFGGRSPIRSV